MSGDRRCTRCHERQAFAEGLCRRCTRELGTPIISTREQEAARIARLQELRARPIQRVVDTGPRPSTELTINGQTYEVNWDGT